MTRVAQIQDIANQSQDLFRRLQKLERDFRELRGLHSALQNDLITLYRLENKK